MNKKSTAKISILLFSILSCLVLFSCGEPSNTTNPETEENKFINTYLVGSFENTEDSSLFISFTSNDIIINPNEETSISSIDATKTKEALVSSGFLTKHILDISDWQFSFGNKIYLEKNREILVPRHWDSESSKYYETEVLDYILISVEEGNSINDYAKIKNGPFYAVDTNYNYVHSLPKYKTKLPISLNNLTKDGNIYSGTLLVPYYSFSSTDALYYDYVNAEFEVFSGTRIQGTYDGINSTFTENITSQTVVSNEVFTKEIIYTRYSDYYTFEQKSATLDFTFNLSTGELVFNSHSPWYNFSNGGKSFKKLNYTPTPEDNSSGQNNSDTSISESEITGSYTISEANGSTFTFSSGGSWTYNYNSRSKEGTWSVSDGGLTISYSLGGNTSTAVFTVSVSGNTYTLTGKSGDYTTIISSAFMITDQSALENGVVTLVKQ